MFKKIDSKMNLPKVEEEILDFWQKEKIFKKSLEQRKDAPLYTFYDGPPFATGTPHYGHIVASTMKDVVPRYWTMMGKNVPRKWGWDCHGLPIENIAEKKLGIAQKKDIEDLGVGKFNETCRSMVLEYVSEWQKVINRLGRWADMDNAYKTMDLSYMESVWWVFKELWQKGLIYEGYRSMHICPRCETTLSQSEVTEGYKMVKDLSAIAKFELIDEPGTFVLAWTTTPWTLIGNVALAVGGEITYVKAIIKSQVSSSKYILAKDRLKDVFKGQEVEIIEEFKGHDLVGRAYKPLFDYYYNQKGLSNCVNGWKVYAGDFVSTEEGTSIVHIAPAFGEDDMNLGKEYNLPFIQHVGMDGIIKSEAGEFAGMNVKPADDRMKTDVEIIKYLAAKSLLFSKEKYEHSYPHCWRCDTPLLNYATSSWFVAVTKIKSKMLELAKEINWSPKHIKEGRFGQWLEGARDWSISRQRYWASCIPIWRCECGELRVIGSVEELRQLSDQKITKIILARHGESEKNVLKMWSSTKDKWPLTDKGRAGVEKVREKLPDSVDVIISSPVLRAKQTAEILNSKYNLEVKEDELVTEIEFGKWSDFKKEDLKRFESYGKFNEIKGNPTERYFFKMGETGESRDDVVSRTREFIKKISEEHCGKTILVVAHGGLYPAVSKVLLDISHEEFFHRLSASGHDDIFEFYLNSDGTSFDLHKDVLDKITIRCESCAKEMKRIPDVLDTWFDSGSMPYAQLHYPFENKDKFEDGFPADFIAEGQDQTRAWFYYLHLLASGIKDSAAFKNVIVNGIVLAEDGKKMSKRLQNYPDPMEVFNKYGADTVRFYLLSSPVMQAENLNFSEKEVAELHRGMFRMLWNSYSFFILYANIDKWDASKLVSQQISKSASLLDKWIVSELNLLTIEVNKYMNSYDLTKATRVFLPFIDNLSNWYIRRSRKRFWKSENDTDKDSAYQTLWHVLVQLSKLLAPFTPFLADEIYKNLTGKESVHLESYPQADKSSINSNLTTEMNLVRSIVEAGLSKRADAKIKVRQPLLDLSYGGTQIEPELECIIIEEVNLRSIYYNPNLGKNEINLNTEITEELKKEGFARELIRNIQSLRKDSGFSVSDRIVVFYQTNSVELEFAIKLPLVAKEVLAESVTNSKVSVESSENFKLDDFNIWIGISRVKNA